MTWRIRNHTKGPEPARLSTGEHNDRGNKTLYIGAMLSTASRRTMRKAPIKGLEKNEKTTSSKRFNE